MPQGGRRRTCIVATHVCLRVWWSGIIALAGARPGSRVAMESASGATVLQNEPTITVDSVPRHAVRQRVAAGAVAPVADRLFRYVGGYRGFADRSISSSHRRRNRGWRHHLTRPDYARLGEKVVRAI